ncbi:ribose-phosphate diphosphokinase [Myxosarcina sp. GI1(2024)]
MTSKFTLFAGSANVELARAVAYNLDIKLGQRTITRFPDGEISVELNESVRERQVFLLQPTSPPVDSNLLELLAFVDACRRSSAARIVAIIPYFGYARSDKRRGKRQAIMASLVANLIELVGIDHLITFDLHAPQIEGFFHIPVDNLTAVQPLQQALRDRLSPETVVVSPDSGRISMAMAYARELDAKVAVLHKQRESGTETAVTHVIGDVKHKPCLIIDDMISTGGTIATTVTALLEAEALPKIFVAATHGLLIENAREKLAHESIQGIFVSDTLPKEGQNWSKLETVSVAPLIAEAICKIAGEIF